MSDRDWGTNQDGDEWAFERAEVHEPSKSPRAVVSVAFPRDDFDRVSEAAGISNMKVSEFIRIAALERVERVTGGSPSYTVSTTGGGIIQGSFTTVAPAHTENLSVVP